MDKNIYHITPDNDIVKIISTFVDNGSKFAKVQKLENDEIIDVPLNELKQMFAPYKGSRYGKLG